MVPLTDPESRVVYAEVWDDTHSNGNYKGLRSNIRNPKYQNERSRYAKECKTRSAPWEFRCDGEVCHCFSWSNFSIWLQPRFVGMQVATEAVAAYYRVMQPDKPRYLQHLHDCLVNDHFHLGVRPVDHVRRIHLNMDPSVLAPHSPNRDPTSTGTPLDVLREIPIKSNFHLTLRMNRALCSTAPHLESLRSVICELKDAGARVQIMTPIRPRNPFGVNQGVRYEGWKHFDISDYYDMPFDEWKVMWENISDAELAKRQEVTAVKSTVMTTRRGRG
jgi:hypothetical protein